MTETTDQERMRTAWQALAEKRDRLVCRIAEAALKGEFKSDSFSAEELKGVEFAMAAIVRALPKGNRKGKA